MGDYGSGGVQVDYGVNFGREASELIGGPGGVEEFGIEKIRKLDEAVNKQMEIIDAINALKAALIKAAQSGDTIDFEKNKELKAALARYNEVCPEPLDFMPNDGKIPKEEVHDILPLLNGQLHGPTTRIEGLMVDVSRAIYNQQAMTDSAKEMLKDWIEAVRLWIRNSKVQ